MLFSMTRPPDWTDKSRPIAAFQRLDRVDALRGWAMVWMTVYHFAFDLNHFRLIHQDFYRDPIWTWQRTAIVSLFLFCAGFGQATAAARGQGWPRFCKRWAQVAGCALLVSIGSWWMFPHSWIHFGVLHGMAVMLMLVRWALDRRQGRPAAWAAAGCALMAGWWGLTQWVLPAPEMRAITELLQSRALNGLGLVMRKPVTEDYVPVLPWLGVMCWGVAMGLHASRSAPAVRAKPLSAVGRALAALGRWSLSYYMLHQPLLIGGLMAWNAARGGA